MTEQKALEIDAYKEPEEFREALQAYSTLVGQVTTYYSEGGAQRAEELKGFIEEMQNYYIRHFQVEFDLQMMVLSEEDLGKYFEAPYGLPWIDTENKPWLICMPVEQAGVVVDGALAQRSSVPQKVNNRLNDLGLDFSTAARLYVDLIGFHEVGHAFCYALGMENLNLWFGEFMATYFSYGFMKDKYPNYATVWFELADVIFRDVGTFQYRKLEEFEDNYQAIGFEDPDNYDWYQKQFSKMVDQIHETEGIDFVLRVIELFKGKKPTMAETKALLVDAYPQFKEWFESF